MNYSEFLKMVPEAVLVAILIAVFIGDFALCKSTRKNALLSKLTGVMLLGTLVLLAAASVNESVSAFGGLYVTSKAVNVMKTILTLGSLIVVLMAQPWVEKTQRLAGEFYNASISTSRRNGNPITNMYHVIGRQTYTCHQSFDSILKGQHQNSRCSTKTGKQLGGVFVDNNGNDYNDSNKDNDNLDDSTYRINVLLAG